MGDAPGGQPAVNSFATAVLDSARRVLGLEASRRLRTIALEDTAALSHPQAALRALHFLVVQHLGPLLPRQLQEALQGLPWFEPERAEDLVRGLRKLPWVRGAHLPGLVSPAPEGLRWSHERFEQWLRAQPRPHALEVTAELLSHLASEGRSEALTRRQLAKARVDDRFAAIGAGLPVATAAALPPGGVSSARFDAAARVVRHLFRDAGFAISRGEAGASELVWFVELPAAQPPPARFELRATLAHGQVTEVRGAHAQPEVAHGAQERMLALLYGQLAAQPSSQHGGPAPAPAKVLDTATLLALAEEKLPRPQVVLACCVLAEAAVAESFLTARPHEWGPAWAVSVARAWAHGRAGHDEVLLALSAAEIAGADALGDSSGLPGTASDSTVAAAQAAEQTVRAALGTAGAAAKVAVSAARAREPGDARQAERLRADVALLRGLEHKLSGH